MPQVYASNDAFPLEVVENLLAIAKGMRALQGIKLAEHGFHNGQDELLIASDSEGATVTYVAAKLAIRPSTVSKMMDRLVAKGLMERLGDPTDARRTLVRITRDGEEARHRLMEVRRGLERDFARSLGADVYPLMAASLAECQLHINRQLNRLR